MVSLYAAKDIATIWGKGLAQIQITLDLRTHKHFSECTEYVAGLMAHLIDWLEESVLIKG